VLASLPPEGRKTARNWIHTAWQLAQDGIDVYARWIARARKLGLSPWLSTRMNDLHNVDDERAYIHSEFWRENPQFRRVRIAETDGSTRRWTSAGPKCARITCCSSAKWPSATT
jgi:hypothetical protein